MRLTNTKLVIFDFDGTLVDSMTGFGEIAAEVIRHYFDSDPHWARTQYRLTSGLPFPLQMEKIFPGDSRNRKAVDEFNRQKKLCYQGRPFYDDVDPTLHILRKRGFKLAISSNNDPLLVRGRLGTERELFFDWVLGFTPGFLKGKDHFERLKNQSQIDFSQMVFVGDSLHDARMAHQNGVAFIGKAGTFARSDFESQGFHHLVIDNLVQLTEILPDVPSPNRYPGGWTGIEVELADTAWDTVPS